MKSSSGKYFIGLDHLRALAAFMVFSWHFIHEKIPFEYVPSFYPVSLINEGHTGVSLFMTLSGYLFAKLLEGKRIRYLPFLWNRFLRLAPLLCVVCVLYGVTIYNSGQSLTRYYKTLIEGIIFPTLPNGGWSITVEFHFYLMLPLLLFLARKSKYSLGMIVCCTVLLRLALSLTVGRIQVYSYFTIIGHIDQFLLGMLAFQLRSWIKGRHILVLSGLTAFILFYWYFDAAGGFYHNPAYPSNNLVWVYLPTLEGLAYGLLIAWYDNSFSHSQNILSRFIAMIGVYSYSIYLLHFFTYRFLSFILGRYLMPVTNFYIAFVYSIIGFLIMVPIAHLSYRYIESPFLKLRTNYLVDETTVPASDENTEPLKEMSEA
ncbi:acyltransferase family protein [Gimesia sp.]|uniref:acyltransferase family protein n=1 Tax=Gimesia sp. TaxID=2024833 RepID=UPI003A91A5CD